MSSTPALPFLPGRVDAAAERRPAPLLPRIAAGDASAVKECLDRYGRLVHAIARRLSPGGQDVDDACQDVFVALWKNAASYDPARSEEATFVALVARRRLIDRHRTRATRALPVSDDLDAAVEPTTERHVDGRLAVAALEACSDEQKRVIVLCAVHGLTHDEVAQHLGIPLGTVKSHYARGIERVRRALRTREDGT